MENPIPSPFKNKKLDFGDILGEERIQIINKKIKRIQKMTNGFSQNVNEFINSTRYTFFFLFEINLKNWHQIK
jgi:hypothetical protein